MNTRAKLLHAARVYIAQSRAMRHRGFAFTLLEWAAKCRREVMALPGADQGVLFA